ncbi:MAG: hypothetical protein U0V74_13855 [Chitinophagales bacterium]
MKKCLPFLLLVIVFLSLSHMADAQCAMCQATAETSRDAGASVADGINKGVLYLFFMPYIVIGTIAYFWWRSRKKHKAAQ